jgi:8-oxo-dGTP pyrophosphatase MutT (NUDIX family)
VDGPTHAGGVVVRRDAGRTQFLLVTARRQPGEWVLPKGHIEGGESAAQAAAREVLEEAGVTASPIGELGELEYFTQRGRLRVQFFLMAFASEGSPGEERERAWVDADEARRRLQHDDARSLITQAERRAAVPL